MTAGKLRSLQNWLQPRHEAPHRRIRLSDKIDYLSKTDLFRDLDHDEMKEVERMTVMRGCPRGTVFYVPEQAFEVLFVLKQGHVNLFRLNPDGRKLVTATVGPGTIFGEMSLISQSMQEGYAEAADDCLICVMSQSDLERLIMRKPTVALRLVELLSHRLRQSEVRLEEMAFREVPARLASALLEQARPDGGWVVGVSHQDLANMTGTSRETITRLLDKWREEGVIELGRMRVALRDRGSLEAVAKGR